MGMAVNLAPFLKEPIISPLNEMIAYEALWDSKNASFKSIAELFRTHPNALPSQLIDEDCKLNEYKLRLSAIVRKLFNFNICLHGTVDYPEKLRDAKHPVELLYYQGNWDLVYSPSIAIVGTRHPSEEGIRRTRKLTSLLVEDGYTIVSGLAKGIDTIAHKTAIDKGGKTIAVIGTPLSAVYPKENAQLQAEISSHFLVISQIPFLKYMKDPYTINRFFFPERNKTMSALTLATVIVEAGETSGTLVQARAALEQGRKLFIMDSCFQNPKLTWPQKFLEKGAIRIKEYSDLIRQLPHEDTTD
jgi:DNA processing protein